MKNAQSTTLPRRHWLAAAAVLALTGFERSALAQMSPAWRAHTSGNVMMNCASR